MKKNERNEESEMISYYELLKRIEKGDIPEKIFNNFKEHLEKNYQSYLGGAVDSTEYYMSCGDLKLLLDYITNLQEENKELNDDNIWWNNRFKAVERDNREYKARCEKAIEYIDKELSFNVIINGKENKVIAYNKAFENVRNILEGKE